MTIKNSHTKIGKRTSANSISQMVQLHERHNYSSLELDEKLMLATCDSKAPLIADVCKRGGAWPALWDTARHLGSRHTLGLQYLTRLLAHHGRGSTPCPQCDTDVSDGATTLIDHVLQKHEGAFRDFPQSLSSACSQIERYYLCIYQPYFYLYNYFAVCTCAPRRAIS